MSYNKKSKSSNTKRSNQGSGRGAKFGGKNGKENQGQNKSKLLNSLKKKIQKNEYNDVLHVIQENPTAVLLLNETFDSRGTTLMHLCLSSTNDTVDLFKYLLSMYVMACFDIDAKKRDTGMTYLHLACKNKSFEIAKSLVYNGSYINCKDKKGNTPLHYAVLNKDMDLMRFLINCGANTTIKNRKGQKPFHVLKQVVESIESTGYLDRSQQQLLAHHQELLEFFFENQNSCKNQSQQIFSCIEQTDICGLENILNTDMYSFNGVYDGQNALYFALLNKNDDAFETLLEHGCNPRIQNIVNGSLLHKAIENGSESILSSLLYHNALIHTRDKTGNIALDAAVASRTWIIVEALIEKHIEHMYSIDCVPDFLRTKFNWVFRQAIKDGEIGVVSLMLKKYRLIDPNYTTSSRWAPIHLAIKFKRLNILRMLVNNGANSNQELVNKFNPIHMVAELNVPDIEKAKYLKVLLNRNARVDAVTKDGYSIIHMLCAKNEPLSVAMICKYHANIDASHPFRSTPYFIAMENEHFDVVKTLIKNGVDCSGSENFSPLFDAVRKGYVDVVETMLDNHVDVNWVDPGNWWSILHMAVLKELDVTIIKKIIRNGASLSSKNRYGYTPLHTAVSNENVEILRLLLEHGASPDEPNNDSYYPIHTALTLRNLEIVNLLSEYQVDLEVKFPNSETTPIQAVISIPGAENFPDQLLSADNLNTLLIRAILESNVKLALKMLGKGANPNGSQTKSEIDYYSIPLSILVRQDILDLTMIKFMLDNRANANYSLTPSNRSLLHFAVDLTNIDLCKLLLKGSYRVNINAQETSGWTPIHIALSKLGRSNTEEEKEKLLEIIYYLIEMGCDITAATNVGVTPLHQIASLNSIPLLKLFISNNINVNDKNNWKITPLDIALRKKHWDLALLLVEAGADQIKPLLENSSWNLLHELALCEYNEKYTEVYELLCKKIDINSVDKNGWTPVHISIINDNLDMFSLFLKHGADLTTPTTRGFTPLHTIARIIPRRHNPKTKNKPGRNYTHHNLGKIFDILIEEAVDVNATDENDYTPLDVALFNHNKSVSEKLLSKKAQVRRFREGSELHLAVEKNNVTEITMFSGSNINDCKGYNQWTALHIASWNGYQECASLLLDMGVDPTIQDRLGRNALHLAGIKQNTTIFMLIENVNRSLQTVDNYGKSPTDYLLGATDSSAQAAPKILQYQAPKTDVLGWGEPEPSVSQWEEEIIREPVEDIELAADFFDWADEPSADQNQWGWGEPEPSVSRREEPKTREPVEDIELAADFFDWADEPSADQNQWGWGEPEPSVSRREVPKTREPVEDIELAADFFDWADEPSAEQNQWGEPEPEKAEPITYEESSSMDDLGDLFNW